MRVELIVLLCFIPLYLAVAFRWLYERGNPNRDMWEDFARYRERKAASPHHLHEQQRDKPDEHEKG